MQTRGNESIQKAPYTKSQDHVRAVKTPFVYQQTLVEGWKLIRTPVPASRKTWSLDHNSRSRKELCAWLLEDVDVTVILL